MAKSINEFARVEIIFLQRKISVYNNEDISIFL